MSEPNIAGMEHAEFGVPGPLRDRLVGAILCGAKTATTSLLIAYQTTGERLPEVGQRQSVLDSNGDGIAVIKTTDVRRLRLSEVDLQHTVAEGEGYSTVAQWRAEHEQFWHSDHMRITLGDSEFTVDDGTIVVAERFHLMRRIG